MNLAIQWETKLTFRNWKKNRSILYTNNEISGTKIKNNISFVIATRKIKYLGITLTKEVKHLYSENCTTLKKEIKKDTNKFLLFCF